MPRIVKSAEARQDEILDVAQRLFMTGGYADTPIQAIIDDIGIAKGTFYHHYTSKADLLEAVVRRIVDQMMAFVLPIVSDPDRSALDKLDAVYRQSMTWKTDRLEALLELARALRSDANALLVRRIEHDSADAFVPYLARIVEQGVAEGVFDTANPLYTARAVYALGMLFVAVRDALIDESQPLPTVAAVRGEVDAFHDAVERLLGATRGSLRLIDSDAMVEWLELEAGRRAS